MLGPLAVAGYRNRDKLGGLLNGLSGASAHGGDQSSRADGLGDMLAGLGSAIGGAQPPQYFERWAWRSVDRFRQAGKSDTADSWIKDGDNAPLNARDLEEKLGDDTLAELTQKTGLSRAELLERSTKTLPAAVNQMTSDGRLPTESEVTRVV